LRDGRSAYLRRTGVADTPERDLLVAIDRLTRDSYLPAEQDDVFAELDRMGVKPPNAMWLYNAAQQLRDDGYIEAYFAGGMTIVNLKLTGGLGILRRERAQWLAKQFVAPAPSPVMPHVTCTIGEVARVDPARTTVTSK
jgi:hypothetical protein